MTEQEREAIKQLESASRSRHAKPPRRKPLPKVTLGETQGCVRQVRGGGKIEEAEEALMRAFEGH